jgi:hypothetical protein
MCGGLEGDGLMEDETVVGLDIGATLQRLLAGQVALQRKLVEQDAKIELLTTLVDSHQRAFDVAKATAMRRGPVQ